MRCFFCGKDADLDDPDTYREVLSWVNGPKLDGPKLREQTGRIAHKDCVDKIVAGQAPDQESMFPEPDNCWARARKGTGEGICDTPLTPMGDCPNASNHLSDGPPF